MPNEPKPTSDRARKRAAGKILRELSIERREAYFDLLVSGYSIEQIASHTQKSLSTVRRTLGQAPAKRRFDAPEDYARIQVARLTKALRCADASLEEGDLKAIVPLLKVVRELNSITASMLVRPDPRLRRCRTSRRHRRRLRSRIRLAWLLRSRSRTKKVARKSS
jgi:hypothetical protein